jgi:tryptophan-rich sensory protein
MRRQDQFRLAALILLCLGVGAAGGWSTSGSISTWYPTLDKPEWTPPGWLFGPVWTTLYVLMGVAGWLVGPSAFRSTKRNWTLWWIQLGLNAIWSPLFFGANQLGLAAIDIVLLWLAIGAFIRASWNTHRTAAVLFLPYWAWVTFAMALNVEIWRLNG